MIASNCGKLKAAAFSDCVDVKAADELVSPVAYDVISSSAAVVVTKDEKPVVTGSSVEVIRDSVVFN